LYENVLILVAFAQQDAKLVVRDLFCTVMVTKLHIFGTTACELLKVSQAMRIGVSDNDAMCPVGATFGSRNA
jgi:hypothetical protein